MSDVAAMNAETDHSLPDATVAMDRLPLTEIGHLNVAAVVLVAAIRTRKSLLLRKALSV